MVHTEEYMQSSWVCWHRLVSTGRGRLRKRIINQPGLHKTVSNRVEQPASSIPGTQDTPVFPGDVCSAGDQTRASRTLGKLSVTEPQSRPPAQCPRELRQVMLASAFLSMVPIIFPENLLTSVLPVRGIKILLINPC